MGTEVNWDLKQSWQESGDRPLGGETSVTLSKLAQNRYEPSGHMVTTASPYTQ